MLCICLVCGEDDDGTGALLSDSGIAEVLVAVGETGSFAGDTGSFAGDASARDSGSFAPNGDDPVLLDARAACEDGEVVALGDTGSFAPSGDDPVLLDACAACEDGEGLPSACIDDKGWRFAAAAGGDDFADCAAGARDRADRAGAQSAMSGLTTS